MSKNSNDNKKIINNKVIEYINKYDRFITKIAFSVNRKCKRLEVEDVKQQIILMLLTYSDNYSNDKYQNVNATYFSQVAINAARNIVRKYWQEKNKVNVECLSLDAFLYEGSDNDFTFLSLIKEQESSFLYPDNYVKKVEFENTIKDVKNHLSEFERKVFILYLDGKSIEYIANKLKRSKKTIYNALSVVKEKVKEKL